KHTRVGQTEGDLLVPSDTEIVERVNTVRGSRVDSVTLLGHEGGHHVFGNRFEQPVLIAEEAVDRRCLYSGSFGDSSCGDRCRTVFMEQARRDVDDPRSRAFPTLSRLRHLSPLRHDSNDTALLLTTCFH